MTNATVNPNEEHVDAAIAEYFEMIDRGHSIDPSSFVNRHRDVADELWSFFEAAEIVESMAGPTVAEYSALMNSGDTSKLMETGVVGLRGNEQRPHQSLDVPSQFGRYRIESELGQGAMGSVYLAYDQQLDRRVAIKIPKFDDASEPEMIERFYREARAAATLRSPHICPVFDVDKIGDVHFIAMAFIDGEPLSRCINRKQFSPRQIATVLHKLAFALQKAHDSGVIHRDLKPSNIMIDSDGEPVVMDFGLARRNATPTSEVNGLAEMQADMRSTSDGAIVGSPAYMSPEQVMGDTDALGPSSDVYSLGVVMYEMLTGRLPYEGSVLSVIGQIVAGDLKPTREISRDIDPQLASICEKMLARKVEHRFPSMSAVAATLGQFLEGKSDDVVAGHAPQKKPIATGKPLAHQFQPAEVSDSRVLLTIGALVFACLLGISTLLVGFFFFLQKPGKVETKQSSRQQTNNRQPAPKQLVKPKTDAPIPKTPPIPILAAQRAASLRYAWQPETNYGYSLEIEASRGNLKETLRGTLIYRVLDVKKGVAHLAFDSRLNAHSNSNRLVGIGQTERVSAFIPMTDVVGSFPKHKLKVDRYGRVIESGCDAELPYGLGCLAHLVIEPCRNRKTTNGKTLLPRRSR